MPPRPRANDTEKERITPEELLRQLDEADQALRWLDRMRWPLAILPMLVVSGIGIYIIHSGHAMTEWGGSLLVESGWPMVVMGVVAGLVCFGLLTYMARKFRRTVAQGRADLLAKMPHLRAVEPSATKTE